MSLSRRERILVLAWSLPDAIRALEATRPNETRRLSPGVWQLCGPCDGSGETRDRWGKVTRCPVCGGQGRYRTDPYADGAPVSGHDDQALERPAARMVACDRCNELGVIPGRWVGKVGQVRCPSCDGSGHVAAMSSSPAELMGGSSTGLDLVAWSFRGGDWDALDSSLEAMRSNGRRPLWRAFVAAYVEPPYAVTDAARVGLEHVEAQMPSRVRVPADVVTAYVQRLERDRLAKAGRAARMGRDHRNREIRAALRLGHSTEDVARMFAVSERTVRRVGA